MSVKCIWLVFLIGWQLSLTDILSELALLSIILWHTAWQQQTPICSRVLRMGAHRKEIPVDKKLHQIREQTEWKITLDLLYIFCKPTQPRTDASSTKWDITLRVTGLPCPAQKLFSHFIPCYFSPCSLKKSCSNMPILETGLSVRKVKVPADCCYNKMHPRLHDILGGGYPSLFTFRTDLYK